MPECSGFAGPRRTSEPNRPANAAVEVTTDLVLQQETLSGKGREDARPNGCLLWLNHGVKIKTVSDDMQQLDSEILRKIIRMSTTALHPRLTTFAAPAILPPLFHCWCSQFPPQMPTSESEATM